MRRREAAVVASLEPQAWRLGFSPPLAVTVALGCPRTEVLRGKRGDLG